MYQRKDRFYRKAKAAGLRSRAAFKIEELGRGLVRAGDRVLDLGAWPGGWLQITSRLVGPRGLAVGVDLVKVQPLGLPNVRVIQGDVSDLATLDDIRSALGGEADVVLSDMAPKLSGIRDRDQARAEELARLALDVARQVLRPGGSFLCKLFMSPGLHPLLAEVKRSFEEASTVRPEASRKGSAELYLIARGLRHSRLRGVS